MRTIGRHWPRSAPRGDHTARCAYCGALWRRSQLYRDLAGLLVCPMDRGPETIAFARPPHVQNNEGTGSPAGGPGDQVVAVAEHDPFPVLF